MKDRKGTTPPPGGPPPEDRGGWRGAEPTGDRPDVPIRRALPLIDHPIVVGLALIVLYGVVRELWAASSVLLLGFLGILVAAILTYPLDFFTRFMPRALALVLTVLLIAGALVGLGFLFVPVVTREAAALSTAIPSALSRLADAWERLSSRSPLPSGPDLASRLVAEVEALASHVIPVALDLGSILITAVVLFVLALGLAYAPDTYRRGLRLLVPRAHAPVFDELWTRVGTTLRRWTAGVLASMLVMGALATVGLWIAGIHGFFLLGVLTFLGTFVPYVGAIASAVPGLLIGLSQSPLHLLYAAIVYLCVHLVEGYLVSPLIMRRAVELRPAALIFWQFLMAAVFGVPGVIVATPLLAVTEVLIRHLYLERRLGKEIPPR